MIRDIHCDMELIAPMDPLDPLRIHNGSEPTKDPSMAMLSGP